MDALKEKLDEFFHTYPTITYPKGEMILRDGDICDKVYYVKRGFVRLFMLARNGKEISFMIYRSGQHFPTLSVLLDGISQYNFEAVTAIEAYYAPRDVFIQYLKNNNEVLIELNMHGGRMMSACLKHIETLGSESTYTNVIYILLFLSGIFNDTSSNTTPCEIPMSHNEIATWINTTRETVSRHIEHLKRKGIITCAKSRIIILNRALLRQELGM